MRHTLSGVTFIAGVLACAGALAAEPLGRLFFTPAQRSALDAGKEIGEPRVKRATAPRGPRELKLDGVVTRSDGESTVWVNGRWLDASPLPSVSATASAADPATVKLKMRGERTPVRLRVGQTLDSSTGRIWEGYSESSHTAPSTTIVRQIPADGPNEGRGERGLAGVDNTDTAPIGIAN